MDGTENTTVTENQETQTQNVDIDYTKIEGMISKGIQQKENSILKSFFEQQGLSEEEAKAAIAGYKDNKAKAAAKKEAAFSNMQKENEKLKAAIYQNNLEKAVVEQAKSLEIDSDNIKYVMKLSDFSKGKDEKGEINAEAVKAAMEAVLKDMPMLKGKREKKEEKPGFQNIGPDAQKGDANATASLNRKRMAMGLKPI